MTEYARHEHHDFPGAVKQALAGNRRAYAALAGSELPQNGSLTRDGFTELEHRSAKVIAR